MGSKVISTDNPHQFKFQGNVLLPWDLDLGIVAQYSSGIDIKAQFGKRIGLEYQYINIASPGTYKYESKVQIDLRAQKHFKLLAGNLSLIADIFNLLNSSRVVSSYPYAGPNFNKIYSIIPPRTFRVGLRFSY